MLNKYKQQSKKYLSSISIVLGLSTFGLTMFGLTTTTVYSETLQMPDAPQSFSVTLPGRGMSMTEVLEKFGEPQSKDPEVGEPPITRWNYPNYNVVFEYQYVIHSLTTNKPMGLMQPQSDMPPANSDTNTNSNTSSEMGKDEGQNVNTEQMPSKSNNN